MTTHKPFAHLPGDSPIQESSSSAAENSTTDEIPEIYHETVNDQSLDEKLEKPSPVSEQENSFHKNHDVNYFPDGGIRAWLCLLGGFLSVFTTWGVITSFGIFQSYYHTTLLNGHSSFQLGWISSLQLGCVFFGGVITGRPFDDGYFYHLLAAGSILIVVCFMLLAECTQYYQVLLCQGIGMGLGMGALFGPCLACTSAYFKKYRGFAMCVCSSGGGVGGIIFPIIANNLLGKIGFPWTMRVLGFIEVFLFAVMAIVMRDKLPFHVRQKYGRNSHQTSIFSLETWVDRTALKTPEYMFFVLGVSMCFFALYSPFAQIQSFSSYTIGAENTVTRYIVAILNSASTVGRLAVYFIAKYTGALNMTVTYSLLASICCYTMFTIHQEPNLIVFTIFYGIISGVVGTFPPFTVPHLTDDITKLGVRFGMCFFGLSLLTSFSVPVIGLTLGSDGHNFKAFSICCGSFFAAGCIFMLAGRISKAGIKLVVI